MNLRQWVTRVRESVAYRIGPRSPQLLQQEAAFYSQQPSCQVGNLWFLLSRYLGESSSGTFVEVGAFDGVTFSNTWGLAERGWHGLLVEPVPQLADLCRKNHRLHPRVTVVGCAVSDSQEDKDLMVAGPLTSIESRIVEVFEDLDWASPYLTGQQVRVPAQTLDALLESEGVHPELEFLSVDVEGHEAQVFRGFSLGYWKPKMITVELSDDHPDFAGVSDHDAEIATDILRHGYRIVFRDWINTVFVRGDIWEQARVTPGRLATVDGRLT